MHEAGGCQPITLTLAMGLWPWDSMGENGTCLSCGVEALSGGWEKRPSLVTPLLQAAIGSVEECRSTLHNTCLDTCNSCWINDGWRGRRNEKMSQRHFCDRGRCLGEQHGFRRGMVGAQGNNKNSSKQLVRIWILHASVATLLARRTLVSTSSLEPDPWILTESWSKMVRTELCMTSCRRLQDINFGNFWHTVETEYLKTA